MTGILSARDRKRMKYEFPEYNIIPKVSKSNKGTGNSCVYAEWVTEYPDKSNKNLKDFRFNDTIDGVMYDFRIPYVKLWSELRLRSGEKIFPVWRKDKEKFSKQEFFLISHKALLKIYNHMIEVKQEEARKAAQLTLF